MIKPLDLFHKINSLEAIQLTEDHLWFLDHYSDSLESEVEILLYKPTELCDIRKKRVQRAFEINLCIELLNEGVFDTEGVEVTWKVEKHVRFGNNLYLPKDIGETCVVYVGHKPMPMIGQGLMEKWKKVEGDWLFVNSVQTWIS